MLKIIISLLSQEILGEIQSAALTELCRTQHMLPAEQEQAQSSVLGMLGDIKVTPSPHLLDLVLFLCNPTFGALCEPST